MSIKFQPKIRTYFSKNGKSKVDSEIEKKRKQLELSRDVLAKNIILPAMARFQFAEYAEIDNNGNVIYKNVENLFDGSWESFRPALPLPKVLSRELRACNIAETEYENFLQEKIHGFSKQGLLEKRVDREDIDLVKIGEAYEAEPGILKSVKTGNIVKSRIKTVKTTLYCLKENTKWYELLRKIFSHKNPVGISFDEFHIGYNPYETFYEHLPPFYQDFNRKLEKVDKIKERKTEKRRRVDPDLAFRLMRLHSNLMKIYSIATRTVVVDRSKIIGDKSEYRHPLVTLRLPYILRRLTDSLPNLLGAIHLDALELSKSYNFPWLNPLQEIVLKVNSRELEIKDLLSRYLKLEKENRLHQMRQEPKEKINYSEIETVLDETVFKGLTPFTIDVRNQLENSLGYAKKTYVFI